MPAKFAVGMALCAISFLVLGVSERFANAQGIVSVWWLVASYLFQSLGELLISGLGLSMISKLVPQRLIGFLMGAWFLTSAISAVTGSWVATFTAVPKDVTDPLLTLPISADVFTKIGICTAALTVVMFITVPMLNRLINKTDA